MAVSLRIVIGGVTATIVLIVATITLAITYTVSISAVRNTGESLASAIVTTVALDVELYFKEVESPARAMQKMAKMKGYVHPTDDPDNYNFPPHAGMWTHKYVLPFRGWQIQQGFNFTSATLLFEDGSIATVLAHTQPGLNLEWVMEGGQAPYNWPNGSRLWTPYSRWYNRRTMQQWNELTQGPTPQAFEPADQRVPGYYTIKIMVQSGDLCVIPPPTIDNWGVAPFYLMYGICGFVNASGVYMGQMSIGRKLSDIDQFLLGTDKTPNTQIFAIDSAKLLVASTHSHKSIAFYDPGEVTLTSNCGSSRETTFNRPEKIGCRTRAANFPYEPLTALISKDERFVYTDSRREAFGKLAGDNYYYLSHRVRTGFNMYSINLVLFLPESDILGDIVAGRNIAIIVTACVFIVAAVASFVLVRFLIAPVDDVARHMYYTSKLTSEKELTNLRDAATRRSGLDSEDDEESISVDEDVILKKSNMSEIRALQTAYTTMDTAIKSFTKYVPRDVVKELMSSNQMCEIQMRPMRCSMLFTDIAGFTSICERVPPHILSGLIRLYFERCSRIVMGHGGVIDKFIGDCIMAVWGAPVPIDHSELRSAVCGRMLIYETLRDPLKSEFNKAGETLGIRVGVATGEVLAGNMGSKMRMNYTVIGDDVNLASRLEGLNKQWGTTVMVSEDTAEECADYLHMRYVISIAVVGKQEPVKVYEVLGVRADANTEVLGRVTSTKSEQQSLNEVVHDREMQELAERYGGTADSAAGGQHVLSTGNLMRRCLRKIQVPPEELTFAEVYGEAVKAWNAGDFAAVVSVLDSLNRRTDVPTLCGERKCVRNIREKAEECMKQPPSGAWTGVWVASEK